MSMFNLYKDHECSIASAAVSAEADCGRVVTKIGANCVGLSCPQSKFNYI